MKLFDSLFGKKKETSTKMLGFNNSSLVPPTNLEQEVIPMDEKPKQKHKSGHTKFDWDAMKADYDAGLSIPDLEKKYGISRSYFSHYALKHGIEIRSVDVVESIDNDPRLGKKVNGYSLQECIEDSFSEDLDEWRDEHAPGLFDIDLLYNPIETMTDCGTEYDLDIEILQETPIYIFSKKENTSTSMVERKEGNIIKW